MNKSYTLLPFRFGRFPGATVLVVNETGDFQFLPTELFDQLISYRLDHRSAEFLDLKGKHFVTDTEIEPVIELLATKYRTRKAFLTNFTALHIVVVTLRCNQKCNYCHASSQPQEAKRWDMNRETAINTTKMIMETPSPIVKIEFQGGEPLLNFDIVKLIIKTAKEINIKKQKDLSFVVCTNLTLITEEVLKYLRNEKVLISTSLDGPQKIHDLHRRMRDGSSSYEKFVKNLELSRKILAPEEISSLVTITRDSLGKMTEVVDEYIRQGFCSIFLRPINPYGYARLEHVQKLVDYPIEDFVDAYKKVLPYIIDLNLKGMRIEECFTSLLLTRILTPFSTGFVDLQSPSGAGISGAVYDYNGDVYPADEGRMLAKMGDRTFFMGNVNRDPYARVFNSNFLRDLISKSCLETLPGCHSCVFQAYCGSDPIRNYAIQGTMIGHRPTSGFCFMHKEIFKYLFEILRQDSPDYMDVFWSWITKRPLESIRMRPCANLKASRIT
jgi:His-Xaa-Ser system radical SAM maturase HxsB